MNPCLHKNRVSKNMKKKVYRKKPLSSWLTKRLSFEVDLDSASQGIGNAKQRRGQVIGTSVWVDPTLEVPIPRQDPHSNQITLGKRINRPT